MSEVLKIKSYDNEDWNGMWFRKTVEAEMKDLDQNSEGNDWIRWIIDHAIDSDDFTDNIVNFICETAALSEVTLKLSQGTVKITIL